MRSFSSKSALITAALLSLRASAQQYSINITNVPEATRIQWCQSQIATCPLLCLQLPGESATVEANDCNSDNLTFDCVCGNGLSPNASEFSQTLPYFLCTEYGNECVTACQGNTACQSGCRDDHPCGAQNPNRTNATTTMSSSDPTSAPSASGNAVVTGLGGSPTTTAAGSVATSDGKKSGAEMALDIGQGYGLAIVFSGIFAGFALVL